MISWTPETKRTVPYHSASLMFTTTLVHGPNQSFQTVLTHSIPVLTVIMQSQGLCALLTSPCKALSRVKTSPEFHSLSLKWNFHPASICKPAQMASSTLVKSLRLFWDHLSKCSVFEIASFRLCLRATMAKESIFSRLFNSKSSSFHPPSYETPTIRTSVFPLLMFRNGNGGMCNVEFGSANFQSSNAVDSLGMRRLLWRAWMAWMALE